jgi:hypothetical protein
MNFPPVVCELAIVVVDGLVIILAHPSRHFPMTVAEPGLLSLHVHHNAQVKLPASLLQIPWLDALDEKDLPATKLKHIYGSGQGHDCQQNLRHTLLLHMNFPPLTNEPTHFSRPSTSETFLGRHKQLQVSQHVVAMFPVCQEQSSINALACANLQAL